LDAHPSPRSPLSPRRQRGAGGWVRVFLPRAYALGYSLSPLRGYALEKQTSSIVPETSDDFPQWQRARTIGKGRSSRLSGSTISPRASKETLTCRTLFAPLLCVLCGEQRLNTKFTETLCALCVGVFKARRPRRKSIWLRPVAALCQNPFASCLKGDL